MSKLPVDLSRTQFADVFLSKLGEYGFGILGKADLEALTLHSLIQSSRAFQSADSYGRAEMLRITDQRYRALIKRATIWLDESAQHGDDRGLFQEFLAEVLEAYIDAPEQTEIRLIVDDEARRRNIQRALERVSTRSKGIPVEISLTGRSLILRGSDLDSMLERVKDNEALPTELRRLIEGKKGRELRSKVLDFGKNATKELVPLLASLLAQMAVRV
jgi:hypothetical protein